MCTTDLSMHMYTGMVELWAVLNGVTVESNDIYVKCKFFCKLTEWTCLIGAVSMVNCGIWQADNENNEACILTFAHTHTHMRMRTQIYKCTHTHAHTHTHTHTHIHTETIIIDCNKMTTATTYAHTHPVSLSHTHTRDVHLS